MQTACEFLSWDSNFFGFRIARLAVDRLHPGDLESALDWCQREQIACLYMLAGSRDPGTAELADKNGFSLTDRRVTLTCNPGLRHVLATTCVIRPSREDDIPFLVVIARNSHRDSRFYYDPRFARSRCDDLYAAWIEKSCRDSTQRVLVATINGAPAGYCSCRIMPERTGLIELCAVAAAWQGNGVGRELISTALSYFDAKDVHRVMVVTQDRNMAAQRLYQRAGFVTESVQHWYHKWFN